METSETQSFNKPYKTTVAIDCRHIGDDNDYSCFLSTAVLQLYKAGNKETAYLLAKTDPMLCNDMDMQYFEVWMQEKLQFEANESERQSHYRNVYSD